MDANLFNKAWSLLEASVVSCGEEPVGTVAARDPDTPALNYDQVFTRDFAVSAIAFLLNGKTDIVKNFLAAAVDLQSREKQLDCFRAGEGLMPASFKVAADESGRPRLVPDFGEKAIARVAPVDSGFWWLYILRVYVQVTGERDLAHRPDFQRAIRLILDLCLTNRFDMFPTLFVPDGSFMIDRRMGVYGYPVDIQALFYTALRAARELLSETPENAPYAEATRERLGHLTYHIRSYFWLDFEKLSGMYRNAVEAYGEGAANQFNIYPESIPAWLFDWLTDGGGYFAGNLGPGRMDFRFFTAGNLMAVLTSLADKAKAEALMEQVSRCRQDLVGRMPMKICFPAITGTQWAALTGSDPKNAPWSYHNGGAWPSLLWIFAAAGIKLGRAAEVREALAVAEARLEREDWPEYYDGRINRLVGRYARRYQTWTCAGYVAAATLLANPEKIAPLAFEEDDEVIGCAIRVSRQYGNDSIGLGVENAGP